MTIGDSEWLAGHLSEPVVVRPNLVFGELSFLLRAVIFFNEPLVIALSFWLNFAPESQNVVWRPA